jgi:2-oxoglutarate dehydrogenase E1 component
MAASRPEELTTGTFMPVLDDPQATGRQDKVTRVILCSGRVAIDLDLSEFRATSDQIAIVRVEQLAPFQTTALRNVISHYPHAEEIVWVQEEPKNMGAWTFMSSRLAETFPELPVHYVGRPDRASPATGSADQHAAEQQAIVSAAFAFEGTTTHTNGKGHTNGTSANVANRGKKSGGRVAAKV